jgi:hypothetical protein
MGERKCSARFGKISVLQPGNISAKADVTPGG